MARNNKRYRIEQNKCREESMEGAKPLQTDWASTLKEAEQKMWGFADKGLFYAAVFNRGTGECVAETADVRM